MKYNVEERIGVNSVAKIFTEKLKWIFREQPINDFGIDAFVEITRGNLNLKDYTPTGELIAVQIKSGKSFFREEKGDHFVFRGSKKHLEYWLNHSIPVILILYNKDTNTAHWQEINYSTVILTGKTFKVKVLKKNELIYRSRGALANIAFFKNSYQYKLWQLQYSTKEINLLIEKQLFLYVEIDHNPSCNNYYITLLVSDDESERFPEIIYTYDEENPNRFEYRFFLSEGQSLTESINDTIPWADLYVDGVVFTDEVLTNMIAEELLGFGQDEWIQDISKLREKNSSIQLACYLTGSYSFRVELKGNHLSHAFLHIDPFLNKEPIVKTRVFI